jgi:HEPN domain-containing protein
METKTVFGGYPPTGWRRRYSMGVFKYDPIRIRHDRGRFTAHFKQKPQIVERPQYCQAYVYGCYPNYHTHQCAEKSLKAYLIAQETDPPYIHDLVELTRLCTTRETSFSTIQSYCVSLNPYGVQVRYPNELAVDDSITGQTINYAEKILEFCEKKINDMCPTHHCGD